MYFSSFEHLVSEIDTLVSDLKTLKFDLLELGGSNQKITNLIDDQGLKTYL